MNQYANRASIVAGGVALALFSIQPTLACHRFKHWSYPWPQSCGAVAAPARVPTMRVVQDTRDPDLVEHDAAVAAHHDEINAMMVILHTNEALGR